MNFVSRWYQDAALAALYDYYLNNPARYENGQPVRRNPLVCMPTGTGKSYVIARFIKDALQNYPTTRVVMLTHVKELIQQNARTLQAVWPHAPLGVYSAGLKRKELHNAILYAGIASINKQVAKLGKVDIVVIDECHLLSPNDNTMYQAFLNKLWEVNPWMTVVGFTATPYRLGIGMLTNNGIFTDIAYDLTETSLFNRLVHEGFIAPLNPKRGSIKLDVSEVGLHNGDYKLKELQEAADKAPVIDAIVRDILTNGAGRRAALVFASGTEHAEHISECFGYYGFHVPAVHSKLEGDLRDKYVEGFKAGKYWGLVNNNILTTGFDHPPVDLIAMVRPTTSTGLWVQMLGRGTRPSPDTWKSDCLVLDYTDNTRNLGPINDPAIPKMKGKGGGDAPFWLCPACDWPNHARVIACIKCGEPHDMTHNLETGAGHEEVMVSDLPEINDYEVNDTLYYIHRKEGKPDSIRVVYQCGMRSFSEWVTLEHAEPAASRARDWWRQRYIGHASEPPTTTREALDLVSYLKGPSRVSVWTNTKYPKVMGVQFD